MTFDWWTLALEIVNVTVLIWLLGRFFWRPVSAMIENRRVTASRVLTEAEAKRNEVTDALVQIEQTRAGFTKEREAVLEQARADAGTARAAILTKAHKEAQLLETAAKSAIKAQEAAAQKAWVERSSQLAVDIAGHLVSRLESSTARAIFLEWLVSTIKELPDAARKAAVANGSPLEAVSATALGTDEQKRAHKRIAAAFGAQPEIVFKTDPSLIAGLELRGPQLTIENSWRADLAHILAETAHDK